MRRILLLTAFVTAAVVAMGQPQGWEVDPASYAFNMTFTGVAKLNFTELKDSNSYAGAFIDGQCRGVAKFSYNSQTGRYYAYLMVYSNDAAGDSIEFRIYSATDNKTYDIPRKYAFYADSNVGTVLRPYVWSQPQVSSQAVLLGFTIPGQIDSTIIQDNEIHLTMPFGTRTDSLVATFQVPDMTRVYVGDSLQQSGVTANDFSSPVVYHVISADESNTADYTVYVEVTQEFQAQVKASNIISPNGDGINDYWQLQNPDIYKDCDIIIFNRFGQIVFKSKGYTNPWDGTYNGKTLPIGTYMFVISCPYCDKCIYKGTITLIR